MQQIQNDVNGLQSQSTELSTLNTDFQSLQSAVSNLDSASQGILAASVSDQNVLSASVGAGALPGTFTVTVNQAGSFISALSTGSVTDPTSQGLDSASSYTLTANGVQTTITPSANNLNALVSAINANPAAGAQATVVNVGSSTSPQYELYLQSTSFGSDPLTLTDTGSSTNLLGAPLTPGSNVEYQVDGAPQITSSSSSVTLSPGVTVNLLAAGTSSVTVAPSSSSISNALSTFVNAYNTAVTDLGKNFGQGGGALAGNDIVYTLQQALNNIGNYTSTSGGITGLSALGVTFETNGQLSFDPTVLAGDNSSQLSAAASFLGSAASSGFLQFATNSLTGIEDPTTGALTTEITQTTDSINSDNQLIAQQQAQVTQMQSSLQAQMAQADSAIATLESQQTFYASLFTSMLLPSPQQLASL